MTVRHTRSFAWLAVSLTLATSGCRRPPEGADAPPSPAATGADGSESGSPTGTMWRSADAPPDGDPASAPATGQASYYGDSLAGNRTASGERYDPSALTAAHRELPFGTLVQVVRVDTGRAVVVRINDRGPFGDRRRVIDLSRAAATELDMLRAGVVDVTLRVVGRAP
jgi:rare lipoprotein A